MKIVKILLLFLLFANLSCMVSVKNIMKKMNHPTAFSPDEKILAAVHGKNIFIYRTSDGSFIKVLKHHQDIIQHIAFLPQGHLLISSGWDGSLVFWDMNTFRPVQEFKAIGKGNIAFSADGSFISLGKYKTPLSGDTGYPTRILSLYPPFNVKQLPSGADYQQVIFSPFDNYFLSVENNGVIKKYLLPDIQHTESYRFPAAMHYHVKFINARQILLQSILSIGIGGIRSKAFIFDLQEKKIISQLLPEQLNLPDNNFFILHHVLPLERGLFNAKNALILYSFSEKRVIFTKHFSDNIVYTDISRSGKYVSLSTYSHLLGGQSTGRVFLYHMDGMRKTKELFSNYE